MEILVSIFKQKTLSLELQSELAEMATKGLWIHIFSEEFSVSIYLAIQ